MTRNVILTDEEFRTMPRRIAFYLKQFSEKGYGFKLVSRESERMGEDIDATLDYFAGVMVQVWDSVLDDMELQNASNKLL